MMSRVTALCLAIPLLAGCTSPTSTVAPASSDIQTSAVKTITFYVGGMNEKLQIL